MIERSTRQLEAVLEAVNDCRNHPTAQEIFSKVRRSLPKISRGTVYRNLDKLQRRQLVRVVRLAGRPTRFDAVIEDHDHFVCEDCGYVADSPPMRTKGNLRADFLPAGYSVRRRSVTFYGLCPSCSDR